jgi:hypothetical protein
MENLVVPLNIAHMCRRRLSRVNIAEHSVSFICICICLKTVQPYPSHHHEENPLGKGAGQPIPSLYHRRTMHEPPAEVSSSDQTWYIKNASQQKETASVYDP